MERNTVPLLRKSILLSLPLLLAGAAPLMADQLPTEQAAGDQPRYTRAVKAHKAVSDTLEHAAARIDAFFGQERIYEEATGTYLQWRLGTTWEDGGEIIVESKIRVKLQLPNIEERARLLLETDPNEEFEEGIPVDSGPGEVVDEAGDSKNFAAALEFSWQKLDKWTLSASPGVKFDFPVDPFIRFRARRSFDLETWVARFTQKAQWYQSDGWETNTILEFDRPIGETDLFRATTRVDWEAEEDNFFPSQNFLFYQQLGSRDALSFGAGFSGETRPVSQITRFAFNVGYRRRLYQSWLFSDLTPQVAYERENDFRPTWSLTLRFEVLFGADYL